MSSGLLRMPHLSLLDRTQRRDLVADYYETEQGKADLANLPLGRAGRLSELDGAILLLASNAASYMAGTVVTADAAHSVRLG